ncbi:SH3 domain-containing protein [Hymenobacter yonginensis]|uniref:SH3 domain-containing protein n=1 Tax=Hymenobacter yonginensis TaxID=748197 RepID=A0ABY7PKU6_9BACT|nr:SH3 domain-containing protein [Hymenobacter yonginensis]WBO83311.1 SH3 domain-containing protein [Hymenobacter yonginensis]
MIHRLSLLTAFSLLCTVGFSQTTRNTNNGVIINSTVVVSDPVYVPVAPSSTGTSAFERKVIRKMEDEQRARDIEYRRTFETIEKEAEEKRREDAYRLLPTYYTTQVVNMRTDGGTEYPIMRQLPKGTVVKVVEGGGFLNGGWWLIHVPGTEAAGYVHPKFLKPRL